LIKDPTWTDTNFEFGTSYRYTVRAVLNDTLPSPESGDSAAAEITPQDTFPPAPPAGLKTIAGAGFISLSWESNPEADLAGYRVWRKSPAEADFRLLTETPLLETNYNDRTVHPGVIYNYALTALDKSGNESPRGTPVAETARSPRP
jgi:hypothetical protein